MDSTATYVAPRRSAWRTFLSSERVDFYVMVAPGIVLYLVLVLIPVVQSIGLSFQDWDGISPTSNWVWFDNYTTILQSPRFWSAFRNNITWSVLSIIPVVLGLVLAAILVQGRIVGSSFFRVCFVLPFILSQVVVAAVWTWIYQPEWGTVNVVLNAVGLGDWARNWLSDPNTALIAVALVGGWTWFGFCMIIFMSGLQGISSEIYDAAKVDGAGTLQTFFRITVPMLRSQIRMLSIITLIFSFRAFDLVFAMTRGGPFQSSEVLGLLVYLQGFTHYRIGQASASAVILTIVVFIISVAVYRRSKEA